MPDSEPLPDAPEFILAGDIDMQVFFDQLGMGWMTPWMPPPIPRLVVVEELCALPQPAAVPFTGIDIARMREGDDAALAVRHKLANFVDRDLWAANCRYTDDTPAEPTVPFDPPANLPPPPPLPVSVNQLEDIWKWTRFTQAQMLPREYIEGEPLTAFGQSSAPMPFLDDTHGGSWAAGVRVNVYEKPDYLGRSNGGDFPVFHDMGWISLAAGFDADSPIKLQHTKMVIYGKLQRLSRVYWNFPPGVEATIIPLHPVWVDMDE